MKNIKARFSLLGTSEMLCIFSLSLLFFSCRENTILPSNLVPAIDNINTFGSDTFTLLTHNIYQDSVLTGGVRNSSRVSNSVSLFHALGSINNDPTFGKTNANIHVEILPPVTNFTFKTDAPGTNRTIDSIVLSIPYKAVYGDSVTTVPQRFKVFRSLKTFSRDEAQFEFTQDSLDNNLLAQIDVDFSKLKTDSPLVGGVKLVPQLRFKLNSWFADSLQAQASLGASGAFADFSKFLEWWKGFYIMADSLTGSAIGYFDTYNTRLHIYYRYTKTDLQLDTVVDVFSFDPNYCNRFNYITRNYNSTVLKNFINTKAPKGDSVMFLQSEPGMASEITMPYLPEMNNVIVNKAELFFYAISPYNADWSDTTKFGMIPRLQIFKTDTSGNDNVLPDYTLFGASVVDGKRYQVSIGGINYTQYKFAVTYAIQRIITEKDRNFKFKIMGLNTGHPASYRVVLAGSDTKIPFLKPQLKIIYTKIK